MGMLDSNTDRSYFMIGAVIIAGLIIGGSAYLFSQGFTDVDTTHTALTDRGEATTEESSTAVANAIESIKLPMASTGTPGSPTFTPLEPGEKIPLKELPPKYGVGSKEPTTSDDIPIKDVPTAPTGPKGESTSSSELLPIKELPPKYVSKPKEPTTSEDVPIKDAPASPTGPKGESSSSDMLPIKEVPSKYGSASTGSNTSGMLPKKDAPTASTGSTGGSTSSDPLPTKDAPSNQGAGSKGSSTSSDVPKKDAPAYSKDVIRDLINQGYIPIATPEDIRHIASDSDQEWIFAKGTEWEGSYVGNLGSNFVQVADIELGSLDGFEPIGHADNPFTGHIDGGNHVLSYLPSDKDSADNLVLFGHTAHADDKLPVDNVTLEGLELEATDGAGESTNDVSSTDTVSSEGDGWKGWLMDTLGIGFDTSSVIVIMVTIAGLAVGAGGIYAYKRTTKK